MTATIGQVYFDGKYYMGEEAKTVGAPALSSEVICNRRSFEGRLNEEGKEKLQEIKNKFLLNYGLVVNAKFSRYAGCKMCPCSPGYVLFADVHSNTKSKEEFRFDIWVNANGKLDFREPKEIWWFNSLISPEKQIRKWVVLVNQKEGHNKFWSMSGSYVAWGAIGSKGQVKQGTNLYTRKESKLKEGYVLYDDKSSTYYPKGL